MANLLLYLLLQKQAIKTADSTDPLIEDLVNRVDPEGTRFPPAVRKKKPGPIRRFMRRAWDAARWLIIPTLIGLGGWALDKYWLNRQDQPPQSAPPTQ